MCRLFGFRSIISSQVHSSLVSAENAIMQQSERHPDGWGVAYYIASAPHVVKSVATAVDDHIFQRVSGVVSSQTVIAHLRKATTGELSILNTHPFQFGKWTFAHNGNIKNFSQHKPALAKEIAPTMRRFILGDTDSEYIFLMLMSEISQVIDIHDSECPVDPLADAVYSVMNRIQDLAGPYHEDDTGSPHENYLTFLLTNGRVMLAFQGGKKLFYSTYKSRCPDRDSCPSFHKVCESPATSGRINHLLFASEPLQGDNIWLPMTNGQIVVVDAELNLRLWDGV